MTEKENITDFLEDERERHREAFSAAASAARNSLFLAAGMILLGQMITYLRTRSFPGSLDLMFFAVLFCTFTAMGIYAMKKPFTALKIGGLVYLIFVLIGTIPFVTAYGAEGFFKGLLNGVLFKVLILTALGKSAPKAKQMQGLFDE